MASVFGFLKRIYTMQNPPKCEKDPNALRVGILGAAAIAPQAIIKPAISHAEVVIYAVAARDLDRAKAYAKSHGIEKVYGGTNGYQGAVEYGPTMLCSPTENCLELLDDPQVDAVYNPLPNGLHYEWTMKALAAGKHVLLEKPSANRVSETKEMYEFAKKRGLVLLEAFHYRFHPVALRAKAILDSGELGPVKSIDAKMKVPQGLIPDSDIRFLYPLGGGAMMDMGCYTLNTLRYFSSSNPTAVIDAKPDVFKGKNNGENSYFIDAGMDATLSFPNDVIGTLGCHLRVPPRMSIVPIIPEMCMKVTCENGELEVFNHILPTLYHWVQVSVKTGKEGKARKTRVEKLYKPSEAGSKGEEWWSTYRYQLEAFVDKIKGREPHAWVSEEDSIANMEWIERVYEMSGLGIRPASTFKLPSQ